MSAISDTDSLSYHLQKDHAELYASLNVAPIKKAPSRNDIPSFKGFAKKKSAQDRKIEFQDSVVRWIMEEPIPFPAVETKYVVSVTIMVTFSLSNS